VSSDLLSNARIPAALESFSIAIDMPQGQRARRIPDAEWDQWRTELVRLYLEECASRKEIIEIMARDHNFVITLVYTFL
jgi:hypothetical protein